MKSYFVVGEMVEDYNEKYPIFSDNYGVFLTLNEAVEYISKNPASKLNEGNVIFEIIPRKEFTVKVQFNDYD